MTMKTTILSILLILSSQLFSQINVGSNSSVKIEAGEFDKSNLKKLQDTKTYFVYKESDEKYLDQLDSNLQAVWNYTELELISYEDLSDLDIDEDYSYFTINVMLLVPQDRVDMPDDLHTYSNISIYLLLWMIDGIDTLSFSRIELFPGFTTTTMTSYLMQKKSNADAMKYLYSEAIFKNWNPLYLKNALSIVNSTLSKQETLWQLETAIYSNLSVLKTNTLYIPDYLFLKNKKFTGEEYSLDAEELLKKYPNPYEVVSISELIDLAEKTADPVYYLSYIQSGWDKYISIFEATTGKLIYSDYNPGEYSIKSRDITRIAREIKNSE